MSYSLPDLSQLQTIKEFSEENPAFPESALRMMIHKADENGLMEARVIHRREGRVYIDPYAFDDWVSDWRYRHEG